MTNHCFAENNSSDSSSKSNLSDSIKTLFLMIEFSWTDFWLESPLYPLTLSTLFVSQWLGYSIFYSSIFLDSAYPTNFKIFDSSVRGHELASTVSPMVLDFPVFKRLMNVPTIIHISDQPGKHTSSIRYRKFHLVRIGLLQATPN